MLKYFSLILFVLFIGNSFSQKKKNIKDDKVLYQQAIEQSIYPTNAEIDSNLVVINEQNPNLVWKTINNEKYILVVTWKQNISYYQAKLDTIYNTGNYPIWITTAPELKNRFTKENSKDTNLRLIQLLGLPPNATYSYFVEFWVKPQDLFRPCPDKEINDNNCQTCFPANTDQSHLNWINENRISRYYQCELYNQYPWTQLGYTYDWNPKNKTHVGLSEFVIGANKSIFVNAIYTTSEYLKK
jgi:hypothetical protein